MASRAHSTEEQSPVPDEKTADPGASSRKRDFIDRLLDTVGALVVVLDTSGRIVRFNEKCEEVTGYSAAQAKGEDVIDFLVPPEEQRQVREVFEDLTSGTTPRSYENHWVTSEGIRRFIRWSNTILRDEDGQVIRVIGTGIDATERRRFKRELVNARSEERRRIGAQLHDMLAPKLAGTAMMVDGLARKLDQQHPEAAGEVRTVAELVREAGEQIRALSHSLVPLKVKNGDLSRGLRGLAERQEQMRDVTCTFVKNDAVPTLSEETASHLYHIASEAVANAAKHADPNEIEIRLGVEDEHLVLAVEDDGAGIQTGEGPNDELSSGGAGLHLMEARSDLIGATFDIDPTGGGGTCVQCSLPLAEVTGPSE